jgi:2-oxoglutarate ferredoxin oxidoreductase subunit alpha
VQRLRDEGLKVSALQMRFIQPMPSGIKDILKRFRKVITVEGTWADRPAEDEVIDEENRRYAPLAMMLRARTLVDVDCWTEAKGQPIKPGQVVKALRDKLAE